MNLRTKLRNTRMSTLDVLIAAVTLSVALLLVFNLSLVSPGDDESSGKAALAEQLMQAKLVQLRGHPVPSSGADTLQDVARFWAVTRQADNLANIFVQVDWIDLEGCTRSSSVSSDIYHRSGGRRR
jgi:Tfp pilus assembly protein PilV